MDIEKLKQWMDVAQNMQGGDFWKNVFDQEFAKQFMNDQAFNSSFTGFDNNSSRKESTSQPEQSPRTFPLIDLFEGDQEVLVLIELPGVPKDKIELGLSGNVLSIKGVAMPLHTNLNPTYSERFYGEFQRQIKLPDMVSPNDLSAKFWNGILFVSYKRFLENKEIIPID
ncbi:Hsp20/alpha crystallin family protein [Neobacillus sp. PS3-40]|uniref:Hsp20/alpha crystallin family protein n=1 Tax=Neobacillus sp. PS3-40 TaxID=3070679 RepID=UPI0027E15BBB|nr:Hsp20/alpha crystallin family protein [Neobacillus sp. PS3-40]WML44931.1 Hsp20/alpha crystallin family protein [Neobacillus sp. PS3-40]